MQRSLFIKEIGSEVLLDFRPSVPNVPIKTDVNTKKE